ncbi:hypothetical protein [Streptomyces sp. NPDC001100]
MSAAAGPRRRPVWLGIGVVVLAVVGGGGTWLLRDELHRAGILPEGKDLFDQKYGIKGDVGDPDGEVALPDGLCGTSLRMPVWEYHSTAADGTRVDVTVERSTPFQSALRSPARAVVTFTS